MELFCLGPKGPDGTDNYTQDDVAGLAKAFTGWSLNGTTTSPDYGKITFVPGRYELTAKTFLGLTVRAYTQTEANAAGFGPARINEAHRPGPQARQPRAVPDPQAVGRVHRRPDPAGHARQPRQRVQELATTSCGP